MNALRFPIGLVVGSTVLLGACLDQKSVAPDEDLPAVLAVDQPTVYFLAYARGESIESATVVITNNGVTSLGDVEIVGGVDYVTERRELGWLRASVTQLSADSAHLLLRPTYSDTMQTLSDTAVVVLRAENSPNLKEVTVLARTLRGAEFDFSVSQLNFAAFPGDPPDTTTLTVRQGGNGEFEIRRPTVTDLDGDTPAWLSLAPTPVSAAEQLFHVIADPGELDGGDYGALLVFQQPDDTPVPKPDTVPVLFTVLEPVLGVSASEVLFTFIIGSDVPPPETIRLSNSGAGDFDALGGIESVTVGEGASDWLGVELQGDSTIVLTADPGSLPADTFSTTVSVSSHHGGDASIDVTFVIGVPTLGLDPPEVSFGLVKGDTAPPRPRSVGVENLGALGTFEALGAVSLGTPAPVANWIRAELHGDSIILTPRALSLSLEEGVYSTAIPVISTYGGSDTLSITLEVTPAPIPPNLALSPSTVRFSALPGELSTFKSARTVRLWNDGGGEFSELGNVSISNSDALPTWLTTAELSGETVRLEVDGSSLDADGGPYSFTVLLLSTQGGDASIGVDFVVGEPDLTLSSKSASFSAEEGAASASPAAFPIEIFNTGAGGDNDLGTVGCAPDENWLTCSAGNKTLTLSVNALPAGLGTHPATVTVSSTNGGEDETIDVTLTVYPGESDPDLVLSATTATFYGVQGSADNPGSQTISATNGGGGGEFEAGDLSADCSATWLTCPLDGTTLTLSATIGDLTADSDIGTPENDPYTADVTVERGDPAVESETVTVSFYILPEGSTDTEIVLSPAEVVIHGIDGSPDAETGTVEIDNGLGGVTDGLGNLSVADDADCDVGAPTEWLTCSVSGSTLTLSADATPTGGDDLDPGSFGPITVTVESDVKPKIPSGSVEVTFIVGAPDLTLSSKSASFSKENLKDEITISNTGAGEDSDLRGVDCSVDVGGDPTWLTCSVSGNTLTLGADLTPGGVPLEPRTYPGYVTVSSDNGGSDETIDVTLTVAETQDPPAVALSPSALRFYALVGTGDPAAQTVTAYNVGEGSLGDISLSEGEGWLTDCCTVTDQKTINVQPRVGSLSPDNYRESLTVTEGNGSQAELPITLVVGTSSLSVFPRVLSFSDVENGSGPEPAMVGIRNVGGGTLANLGTISVEEPNYLGGLSGWLQATFIAPDSVKIQAVPGDLPASADPYQARVPVVSNPGGNDTILVSFSVEPAPIPPSLSLSRSTMAFEGIYGDTTGLIPQSVIASPGGGAVLGVLSIDAIEYNSVYQGWLDGEESISIDDRTVTLQPTLDFGTMEGDTSRATVTIASLSGGESLTADLDVALIIKRPILRLSTDTVSFSALVGSEGVDTTLVFINNVGAGPPRALGEIRQIDASKIEYIEGKSDWLQASLVTVEGGLDQVEVSPDPAHLVEEGLSTARLPVESEFGGEDTLTVTLAVRNPDSSFDEQTIQFVDLDNLAPYPGDSLVVDPAPSPTGTRKVGVRNGSRSLLDLVGLSVSEVNYIEGDSAWLSPAFERTTASFEDPAVLFIRLETRDLSTRRHIAEFTVTSERYPLFDTQPKGTFRVVLEVR